jgi:hypothetical protein
VADVADADLLDLTQHVGVAHVEQVCQRIAAPQLNGVGEQGGRAVGVTVGPCPAGLLVQDIKRPQVHGKELGRDKPDHLTVGAQVIARVTAGPAGFEQPAKVGQRHPHVPGRLRRIQSRPEQLGRLIAGQGGVQDQRAEQLAHPGTPELRRVDRHAVPRQAHRSDHIDLGPVRGRRGQRREEQRGSRPERHVRPCRLAELPVNRRPERVGQPAAELVPVRVAGGRQARGQFNRPRQRQEAQRVRRGKLPGGGQVARPGLHQDACGRPRREVRGTKGDAIPVRAQPVAQDVTEGQKPAQVPFGEPVLDGPSGQVVSVGLPRRRLRAAGRRYRCLGGVGQHGSPTSRRPDPSNAALSARPWTACQRGTAA